MKKDGVRNLSLALGFQSRRPALTTPNPRIQNQNLEKK